MGCGSELGERTLALFDLHGTEGDLYALPFPNDIRRQSDGTMDLMQLEKDQPPLLQSFIDLAVRGETGGFALNGAAYFRFRGPLDPVCLPSTPAASLEPGSSVVWVNIEPGSPEYGKKLPVRIKFTEEKGRFIGENALAVMPVPGFSLLPSSHYAVILTEGLCDNAGHPIAPDADFLALLSAEVPERQALVRPHQLYAPLRQYLAQSGLTGVISAAVFTTADPTAIARRAREVLYRGSAPVLVKIEAAAERPSYYELQGTYRAPNFQQGEPPFMTEGSGGIAVDSGGYPKITRMEDLRVAISIPKGEMPPSGWPIVIYAHGTYGHYRSFIVENLSGSAAELKTTGGLTGLAMAGIDQNLHGTRVPEGTSPDIAFFNVFNPRAAVYNTVQAGIDDFSLLRLLQGLSLSEVPWQAQAAKSGTLTFNPPARFDPQRVYFMGHSQGGITGPVFLAYEPGVQGAVLSGAGGALILSLLNKVKPISIRSLIEAALTESADEFHPILSLLQMVLEPAETLNYGRMLIHARPTSVSPKHIFMTEGISDHYTPNANAEALAVGLGVPQLGPVLRRIEALDLLGLTAKGLPVSGNLTVDGQSVTAGLLQYRGEPEQSGKTCKEDADCDGSCYEGLCRNEGHFVVFEGNGRRQAMDFLSSMTRYGVPSIGP